MKKRLLSVILVTALVSGSVLPVSGAEFTGGEEGFRIQEETFQPEDRLFYDEAEVLAEDDEDYTEDDWDDMYTPYWTPVSIKLITGPERTEYWYPLDITNAYALAQTEGVRAEITYQDGRKGIIEFDSENCMTDDSDDYVNVYNCRIDYDTEKYDDPAYDLPAGDYPFVVECTNRENVKTDQTMIHVKPLDELPLLNNVAGGAAETVQKTLDGKVYFKMVAQQSGNLVISDNLNQMSEYEEIIVWDTDYEWPEISGEKNNIVSVKKGETYYFAIGVMGSGSVNTDREVTITTEYAPEAKSVKVVREPVDHEIWEMEDGDLKGIRFEVAYEDGTAETIDPCGLDGLPSVTSCGDGIFRYYDGDPENTYPMEGLHSITYTVAGESFTYDAEYHSYTELPVIKETGSVKGYTTCRGNSYVLFQTGSEAANYVISNTKKADMAIGMTPYDLIYESAEDGETVTGLKPNTIYVLYTNPEKSSLDDVVFTVTGAKQTSLSECTVKLASIMAYTAKPVKPAVTVTDHGTKLKENVDYTVAYSSNKYIGTGTVKITGRGNYEGTVTRTFKIALRTPALKTAKSAKAGTAAIGWNKVTGATGYVIYVKAGNKWKEIGKTRKNYFVHTGTNKVYPAKSKTVYTYTVKAYKTVAGKTYASNYNSKGISVKIK